MVVCLASGCVPSYPLPEGRIDNYWYLQQDTWGKARQKKLTFGGKTFPSRWVFRRDDSLIWSTVSIVRAIDKLKAGSEEFNVTVSPTHAKMLAVILADTRKTLGELRKIADPEQTPSPEQWSAAVASALVSAEKIARVASAEEDHEGASPRGDPGGWSAGPMIRMLAAYLNERTGGGLLEGMAPDEAVRLREVMSQVVLRLSFAAAGKQDPPELLKATTKMMRQASRPEELRGALTQMLLESLAGAPPAEAGNPLPGLLSTVFATATYGLRVVEHFVQQWDKMESVELELREMDDQPIVSAVLKVRPGRQLRMATLFPFQPVLAFRGATRITVQPRAQSTRQVVILFEPLAGGRAELRFEGIVYGLVRLLALPLADAALREVRVSTESGPAGSLTSVTVLMEAIGRKEDAARIMAFQDVRNTRIERGAFKIERVPVKTEQVFNYLTPRRRYTYRRTISKSP